VSSNRDTPTQGNFKLFQSFVTDFCKTVFVVVLNEFKELFLIRETRYKLVELVETFQVLHLAMKRTLQHYLKEPDPIIGQVKLLSLSFYEWSIETLIKEA
jgi:hypothetical protein